MSDLQIAWLELATVGGVGFLLTLFGIVINGVIKKQNELCTEKTNGMVIKYGFPGEGRMYPVLEYFVDGKGYQTKKKFRGIKRKRVSGLPTQIQPNAYEDEKGWLHVKIGFVVNLRHLAEELWPIGSRMTVYYNPNDPKKCYVDRPISGCVASIMFILMGMVTMILSVVGFFLIQL